MICEKTFVPPKRVRKVVNFPLSRMRVGAGVDEVTLWDLRQSPNGLIEGEQLEPISTPFSEETRKLFAAGDELFALNRLSDGREALYAVFHRRDFYGTPFPAGSVRSVCHVTLSADAVDENTFYAVTDGATYLLRTDTGEITDCSGGRGGLFGFLYAGRFFLAREREIVYTDIYPSGGWKIDAPADPQGGGTLTVLPACGKLVAGVVFGDDAYFFAQYGALKVHVGGKILNTKTVFYPQGHGEPIADTCRVVDGRVYFLTKRGIVRFDGERFEKVDAPHIELVGELYDCEAAAWNNKYVFLADNNWDGRMVYVYDPRYDRETVLGWTASSIAADGRGFAVGDEGLCEMTVPENYSQRFCELDVVAQLQGLKNPVVEWIGVDGHGTFDIEVAVTGNKKSGYASGLGNTQLPLTRALPGSRVQMYISAEHSNFAITGIRLGVAEEEQYDD